MLWNFFTFEKKFENVQQPSRQANRFSLLKFGKKRPKSFRFVAKTEGKRSIVFRRFFFITKCNEHWSVQFHTLLVVVFHIPPGFSIRVTLTRIPGNPLTIPGVCVEYFACSYSSLHFIVFEQTHTHTHTHALPAEDHERWYLDVHLGLTLYWEYHIQHSGTHNWPRQWAVNQWALLKACHPKFNKRSHVV